MKKRVLLIAVVVLVLTSCAAVPNQETSREGTLASEEVYEDGEQSSGNNPQNYTPGDPAVILNDLELDEAEISGIIFMREEEKLARDVYLKLADLWGMNIFTNIAGSENTHMDAVLSLIEMADLEDPIQAMGNGEFLNQDLQSLYDDLISRGGGSLAEALLVGAAIEEIDILDLQEYLVETDNYSVRAVYQNLLNGSINHLNSFVRTYERQTGEEYQPQYMTEETFQELLATASRGGGGAGQAGRSEQPRGGRGQAQ
jgi:hypothetical protein